MQSAKKRRRRRKKILAFLYLTVFLLLLFLVGILLFQGGKQLLSRIKGDFHTEEQTEIENAKEYVAEYADTIGYSADDYPESLLALLESNPDAKDFVLNYPIEKDKSHNIDLSEYKNSATVPLFLQWDNRWGYESYGNDIMGITGCGPTCLSMVAVYVLHDTSLSPLEVAHYSIREGYCVPGSGTSWSLMSKGAEGLGLEATELPLDEDRILRNLKAGNPVICIMGPGDFTTSGHFIVLTGYKDGKISINDPNSPSNSEKTWKFDELKDQIRNLWTYRKA